jgi:hypothetical protein
MPGIRLELADPANYSSPSEYIEQHLAPVVTELHRLTNELFVPGSTSEEHAVDMVQARAGDDQFRSFDRRLYETAKHVVFDGSAYFSLPKELLRVKQAKVQFTAVIYVKGDGEADFRLVRDDGVVIQDSTILINRDSRVEHVRRLPFGDQPGSISPENRTYYIQASNAGRCIPVCRRFSLSFVYI